MRDAADYFLPEGYVSRLQPEYFVDEDLNAVCQPDVYPEAAAVARKLGCSAVVDVGCGTAAKLAALHPEFRVVGIDFGSNLEACRARYDFGTWIEANLDRPDKLPVADFRHSVIVCADVIEHLVYPEHLLSALRGALRDGVGAILLSTPEREFSHGAAHLGPPPNEAHVREWSSCEFERLLVSFDLRGHVGLTRSNDQLPYMRTILAAIPGEDPRDRAILDEWWEARQRWERIAVDQDRAIQELERASAASDEAKAWLEEQRAAWQRAAEELAAAAPPRAAPLRSTLRRAIGVLRKRVRA